MKFFYLQVVSALFISIVAAWFSVVGLMAVFPGAPFAILAMAAALEMAKLVTASWTFRFWKKAGWLRHYFVLAVVVLSLITSLGIFGYLSRAHIEGKGEADLNTNQITLVENRIAIERQAISSDQQILKQMDDAVSKLLSYDRITVRGGAIPLRNQQRPEREALQLRLDSANARLVRLLEEQTELQKEQSSLETEIGPIKYLAQLIYKDDSAESLDRSVRWLVVCLMVVFDPLAILLFVAASITLREANQKPEIGTNLNRNEKRQIKPPVIHEDMRQEIGITAPPWSRSITPTKERTASKGVSEEGALPTRDIKETKTILGREK